MGIMKHLIVFLAAYPNRVVRTKTIRRSMLPQQFSTA
jgi:hypothetical protein